MYRLFFVLILGFLSSPVVISQTNRAFLVMISHYPENSGWSRINGGNDARLVIPMLIKNGYNKENIRILTDENATKSRIIKELGELYKQSQPGDYVYIHFSCHGQQMVDDNGDEEDGLDEALIPYDAIYRFRSGRYEGENHLRDDLLGELLEKIRLKITASGNITVLLDACHSGTGTREEGEVIRGTSYIFGPPDHQIVRKKTDNINLHLKKNGQLSPITVISACQPDEQNHEYKKGDSFYGTLSYAFCNQIHQRENISNIQFHQILENYISQIQAGKKKKQTPYIESTHPDNILKIGR